MTAYRVTNPSGLRWLANGRIWRKGDQVGERDVPPVILNAWIAESLIEPIEQVKAAPPDPMFDIHGMTPAIRDGLALLGYDTVQALAKASPDALTSVPGLGRARASKFIDSAERLAAEGAQNDPTD